MITKYIEPLYFLIALCAGLFYTYVFTPLPEIVLRHPTPDNNSKTVYKDKNEMCYKYYTQEVDCPRDRVEEIPIQFKKNIM